MNNEHLPSPTAQDVQEMLRQNPVADAQLRAIVYERLYREKREELEKMKAEAETKSADPAT